MLKHSQSQPQIMARHAWLNNDSFHRLLAMIQEDLREKMCHSVILRCPSAFGAERETDLVSGWAYSGYYFYEILKGCSNELADKHIAQVQPRQDTLAGPKGRRADTARFLLTTHL